MQRGGRHGSDADSDDRWGGPPGPQPTPRSAGRRFENFVVTCNYAGMTFYRRRLPHFYEIDQPVFLTWRLHDRLPPNRTFPTNKLNSGQAFAAMEAIHYNANVLGRY